MKPHPRIRKTIKWGGAAVTVLLVVVWIGSGWWSSPVDILSGSWIEMAKGRLLCGTWNENAALPADDAKRTVARILDLDYIYGGLLGPKSPSLHMFGQFRWIRDGNDWILAIPYWVLVLAILPVTATAWRLDTLARRRARIGFCPKCGYDRTGLARDGGAKCPECGSAPAAASAE